MLAVRASEAWMIGSYAFGVTRLGSTVEPEISLPPQQTSNLQIETIEASAMVGQAEFAFRGDWGPIRRNSGLRVWVDTDPGENEEDEWEYLLRSNDGRQARLWSFAQRTWIDSSDVGARGFDTLLMRWNGRTADARIRWQASVRNTDGTWTVSRPESWMCHTRVRRCRRSGLLSREQAVRIHVGVKSWRLLVSLKVRMTPPLWSSWTLVTAWTRERGATGYSRRNRILISR